GRFGLGHDFMSNGTVMMSGQTFAGLLTGNRESAAALPVEYGVIKVQPGADVAAVQQALAAALSKEVRVFTKPQLIAFETTFQADLSSAGPIFWMGTLVGFVVGMLISYQVSTPILPTSGRNMRRSKEWGTGPVISCGLCSNRRPCRRSSPLSRPGCYVSSYIMSSGNSLFCRCT